MKLLYVTPAMNSCISVSSLSVKLQGGSTVSPSDAACVNNVCEADHLHFTIEVQWKDNVGSDLSQFIVNVLVDDGNPIALRDGFENCVVSVVSTDGLVSTYDISCSNLDSNGGQCLADNIIQVLSIVDPDGHELSIHQSCPFNG